MPLDGKLRQHVERLLILSDDDDGHGARLLDDAARLWSRVRRLASMNLVAPGIDTDALELACFALQFPSRQKKGLPVGKFGQVSLRDRSEQSAELLIGSLAGAAGEALLDRAAKVLQELTRKTPALDESRLLADAINLEDFGMTGLLLQSIQVARRGRSLSQAVEGYEKRQQYGYWEARLKDGFHFEPVRQIARRRLANAIEGIRMLTTELSEDSFA